MEIAIECHLILEDIEVKTEYRGKAVKQLFMSMVRRSLALYQGHGSAVAIVELRTKLMPRI